MMEVENLNCLICSGELHVKAESGSLDPQLQINSNFNVLWKLLELDSRDYEWVSNDFNNSSIFCYSCEKKIQEIQEIIHQVEILQSKLKTWSEDIQKEIIATNSLKASSLNDSMQFECKSDSLRNKIVSDLFIKPGDKSSIEVSVNSTVPPLLLSIVKEEVHSPHHLLESENDFNIDIPQYSPPASPAPSVPTSPPREADTCGNESKNIHTFTPDKSHVFEKELAICLQPIDEIFSRLKSMRTIRVKMRAETADPVIKNEVIPRDVFDATTYHLPTKCKIPNCISFTVFSELRKLIRHIRDVHLNKKVLPPDPLDEYVYPARCPRENCPSETLFTSKNKLRRHMNGPQCKAKKHSNGVVDLSAYNEFPTKCLWEGCISTFIFERKDQIKRHIYRVHLNPNKIIKDRSNEPWHTCTFPTTCPLPNCKNPKLVFKGKWNLRNHIKRSHEGKRKKDILTTYEYPRTCPIPGCKSTIIFPVMWSLRRHIKNVHRRKPSELSVEGNDEDIVTIDKTVICEICGAKLSNESVLQSHLRIHTGNMLVCDSCGAKFRTKTGLTNHRNAHHAEIEPVYPCTYCSKTFKVKRGLEVHLWRHTGVKRKICPICSAGFFFKIDLEEHKRYLHYKELGLEPFQCKICSKIYSKRCNLAIHMKSHTGTDRFSCNLCTFTTSRTTDYKEHMATVHVSDFPHKCQHCSKSFKLKRRLREHEKYHQDNYPHECELCSRRCSSGRTLKIHLFKKHGKDVLPKYPTNNAPAPVIIDKNITNLGGTTSENQTLVTLEQENHVQITELQNVTMTSE